MPTVLIVGSGGRESALAWKLRSQGVTVFIAPGNGGEKELLPDVSSSAVLLHSVCMQHSVDLVLIGPEAPLCGGIVDDFMGISPHIPIFGPTKDAARIEGSKVFSKEFMARHGIPSAAFDSFTTIEDARSFIQTSGWSGWVVKADGLAAGKGVIVTHTEHDAVHAAEDILQGEFGRAGERIVVEKELVGSEISALCFTDGETFKRMPLARDHKRLLDGDEGPNTGGMGVIAPVAVSDNVDEQIDTILRTAIDGMRKDGTPFRGVLYAGLMVSPTGEVNVLEFNARFGDPETEVLLPLLKSPLYDLLHASTTGNLEKVECEWISAHCCGVILSSKGYPQSSDKGTLITEIPEPNDVTVVFHCGTRRVNERVETNGGRVLCVSSIGSTLEDARRAANAVAHSISFDGKHFRRDIGMTRASSHSTNGSHKGMSYGDSGVNVNVGNEFVDDIRSIVKATRVKGTEDIGGFGAVIDLCKAGMSGSGQLVVGVDGVGTKIAICDELNDVRFVGYDVVGMCVNDILCHCSRPLAFLDYYVCGKLKKMHASQVVSSIAAACMEAECALVGGETAEMPGVYLPSQWDVAGCAIGVRESSWPALPDPSRMEEDDVVIGIASNGAHSNGFSLIRNIFTKYGIDYKEKTPWDEQKSFGECLLAPTRIYVKALLPLLREGSVKGAAHITGGGITDNSIRALDPRGELAIEVDLSSWNLPPLFNFLANRGPIEAKELLRTFNCGVGMCLIVGREDEGRVVERLERAGEKAWRMGRLTRRRGCEELIVYKGMQSFVRREQLPLVNPNKKRCRVAILISGSGSNMRALIESTQTYSSHVEISCVISNKADAGGLAIARSLGVPTVVHIPHTKDRVTGDMAVHEVLQRERIELVCLAGFMRLLSADFVSLWKDRVLNVHPSLLPSFKGAHAVEDALAAGVKVTGCTVHFVETEMDSGRIVAQSVVEMSEGWDADTLHREIQKKEHQIFPHAMHIVANHFLSHSQ